MKTATRDNILYLTIALGIVGVGGIVVWYQEAHGLPIRMPISDGMAAFFITTSLVFGYTIKYFRKLWSRTRFWVMLGVIFLGYLPLQWRLLQFTGMRIGLGTATAFVELLCLLFILEKLVPPERHRHEAPHQEG